MKLLTESESVYFGQWLEYWAGDINPHTIMNILLGAACILILIGIHDLSRPDERKTK